MSHVGLPVERMLVLLLITLSCMRFKEVATARWSPRCSSVSPPLQVRATSCYCVYCSAASGDVLVAVLAI
jgi:hypothetical protein